jgi:hypothetical protein
MNVCALCLKHVREVGALKLSHIYPRFMLLLSKQEGKSVLYNYQGKDVQLGQYDWKEYLLCGQCEHHIKHHEDFLKEVLYSRRSTTQERVSDSEYEVHASSNAVALAVLTILWRGCITNLPEFKDLRVVTANGRELLRTWIYNNSLPSDWKYYVAMKISEATVAGDRVEFIFQPHFHRISDVTACVVLTVGGYIFEITMPVPLGYDHVGTASLIPNSRSFSITKVELSTIPSFKAAIDHAMSLDVSEELQDRIDKLPRRRK